MSSILIGLFEKNLKNTSTLFDNQNADNIKTARESVLDNRSRPQNLLKE